MDKEMRNGTFFILGLVVACSLIFALYYWRQRLFTRTEPIVLVDK